MHRYTYLMGIGVFQITMYNLHMEMYQVHQVRQKVRWHLPLGVVASPNMATSLQTPKLHAYMLHASCFMLHASCFMHLLNILLRPTDALFITH